MIKEKFIKVIKRFNPKSNTTEKDLRIFMICFIISFSFWLLNALSKTYSTNVTYPVQYKDLPKDRVIISELPAKIQLRVNGFGFALLRLKMQLNPTPIIFNVSKFTNKNIVASSDTTFAISSIQLKKQLSNIISSEVNIEDIEPGSIYIKFENIIQKKVEVNPKITISPKQQYLLVDGIKTEPKWVTISGPQSIINKIQSVNTEVQKYTEVSKPIKRLVSIENTEEVEITPHHVKIEANIEQFTEGRISKTIETFNLPDSISIFTFPKSIIITYTVPISQFKYINETSFETYIDWDSLSVDKKATLNVKQTNPYIHNYHYQTKEVDYIIEKNTK
ncbi:hypothetical protein K5X82_02520 [Halosquirtibacter xylanolyticus]|uniref:CdaR family protein n=1 Tax=Halosquirtibacter xylanolyticus TaxID=3374599 RepID=UPI00374A8F67|nr:hypothetical protein K5X82_02520 [Prolixibacteraceae bacterium]